MRLVIAEIFFGILMFLIAVIFFVQSLTIQSAMDTKDVGPAAFPLLITIMLGIFAAILLIQGIRGKMKGSDQKVGLSRGFSIIGFVAALMIYTVVISSIGYYISTLVFIPVLLLLAGEKRWKVLIGVTILFLAFAKLGFNMLLGVPLP